MDYVIIVNDNGELKTISAADIQRWSRILDADIDRVVNRVLDDRSAKESVGRAEKTLESMAAQRVADDTEHANRGQR